MNISDKSKLHIREAEEHEAAILSELAIQSKAYWGYGKRFLEDCIEALTVKKDYISSTPVFVLEVEWKVVGFFAFYEEETWSLDFFFIKSDFIGKGFGKVMWEGALQIARDLGITSFKIDSDPYAKDFYEKMGAVHIGSIPSTVWEGRRLPLMKVDI
ncbi:GNAT family N-acetyltransferase [Thalassobacillus pellis]|uniref:GNAT family N-acetyltransferase n=1 Tax=Thalassobacillus pellis TaxID=748008 RepID=UPI001960C760|nr:GNAT family N-acetyltransferase [Thalassobacillus pellis]MBM7553578.1 GNAT superfamily N-acetyltransferase [Thalassobacillus pellis]